MNYLKSVEMSRVEMSPADDNYSEGPTKRASYTLLILKLVEMCLIICCIGLIDEPASNSQLRIFITPRVSALCYVTFGCILIYTIIYLIMALFGDMSPWRINAFWSLTAFTLFLASTAVLFRDWSNTKERNYWHPNMQRLDLVLATASVALVTSVLFIVDLLATLRFGINGDLE